MLIGTAWSWQNIARYTEGILTNVNGQLVNSVMMITERNYCDYDRSPVLVHVCKNINTTRAVVLSSDEMAGGGEEKHL